MNFRRFTDNVKCFNVKLIYSTYKLNNVSHSVTHVIFYFEIFTAPTLSLFQKQLSSLTSAGSGLLPVSSAAPFRCESEGFGSLSGSGISALCSWLLFSDCLSVLDLLMFGLRILGFVDLDLFTLCF